jgi:hypothetical protein
MKRSFFVEINSSLALSYTETGGDSLNMPDSAELRLVLATAQTDSAPAGSHQIPLTSEECATLKQNLKLALSMLDGER